MKSTEIQRGFFFCGCLDLQGTISIVRFYWGYAYKLAPVRRVMWIILKAIPVLA